MWRKSALALVALVGLSISLPGVCESAKSKSKTAKAAPAPACAPRADLNGRDLCGKWTLVSQTNPREQIGTLTANGRYFTIELAEPEVNVTAAYTQGENGDFRCTIIDKAVLIMEGAFDGTDRLGFAVNVKELGKPGVVQYPMTGLRETGR